ncbi:uncharacterized protein LOC111871262 [Cryptotermes secundus]|uniref:uncharacterized protein LOC111871262 n=1 Tax=Cryptotermes secundus TaxID=105785 RepID=UPI000CD7C8A0|nr:uncharacterized protein LOC111871262 [Cryptotermes secundus]
MEQMMEHLVAVIEKMDAKIEANKEKIETNQEKVIAKLDAHHESMMARLGSQLEKMEATVDVFKERLNKMDTTDLEAVAEQQDAPKEEAMVETIRVLVEQYGDQHLANRMLPAAE